MNANEAKQNGAATWDARLGAWVVDEADACRRFLTHESLSPPPYVELYGELEERFGLDFSNLRLAFGHIPLCLHGARHAAARKAIAGQLARRRNTVLSTMAERVARHFRSGLPGYGDSFRGLVEAVARDFPRERYRRTVAIGASMGGLPSVWYGLMAGANRTICIGGRAAWDVTRMLEGDGPAHAYDPICACIAEPHPEIVFVYAQDHAIDRIQAGHFAGILGAQTLPIPGVRNHSPLGHLWETGSLTTFLTRITQARSFRPRWVVQKKDVGEP